MEVSEKTMRAVLRGLKALSECKFAKEANIMDQEDGQVYTVKVNELLEGVMKYLEESQKNALARDSEREAREHVLLTSSYHHGYQSGRRDGVTAICNEIRAIIDKNRPKPGKGSIVDLIRKEVESAK